MTKRYITVVFEYTDGAALPKELTTAFKDGGSYRDAVITAISMEDEISRVEQFEQQQELRWPPDH